MFYLVLGIGFLVVSFVLFVIGVKSRIYGMMGSGLTCLVISLGLLISNIGIGINALQTYADLSGKRQKVLALQSEIEAVRSSIYPNTSSSAVNQLIGGSLDNIKQSTNLSEFIVNYAEEKANYNSELARVKAKKKLLTYYWFADGWAIPSEVLSLEEIK